MRALPPASLVLAICLSHIAVAQADADRAHARPQAAEEMSREQLAAYEEAVARAFSEFELQNYPEARTVFLHAHGIYPNARTLRALGMVEYELKNYVLSISYLEAALGSHERPLTPKQRQESEALLKQARGFVGRYQLAVRPAQASVQVNGETARLEAGVLSLGVGEHLLEVQADEHRPFRRELHVIGGEAEKLEIVLSPVGRELPAEARAQAPVYKKWWLWTAVGLVVAGGVVAGVLATREPEPRRPSGGSTKEVVYLLQWGR